MNINHLPEIVQGQRMIAIYTAEMDKISAMIEQLANEKCGEIRVTVEMHNLDTCAANNAQSSFGSIYGQPIGVSHKTCRPFAASALTDVAAIRVLTVLFNTRERQRQAVYEQVENLIISQQHLYNEIL